MNPRVLARWRMHNLRLSGPTRQSPEELVGHLGAVQCQNFAPGKWSIAQRAPGLDDAHVSRAFDSGRFIRTHVLRPTWHFVLAEDIGWMLQLTGPRVLAKSAGRYRELGLDEPLLCRCRDLFASALAGGKQMTRSALRELLLDAGVTLEDNRFAHILGNAELRGLICSGAVVGKQQTYALLEERCPRPRQLTDEQALEELVRRYFTSHSPATLKDFSWWSGLPLGQIKRGLEMVPEADTIEVEGLTYRFIGAPPSNTRAMPLAHLLQTFDEYVVGYTESRNLLDRAGIGGAIPNRSPGVVILDGQLAGHWKRKLSTDRVDVQIELLRKVDATERRALEAAAGKFGEFLGLEVALSGL